MKRREFLKNSALAGMGMAFMSSLFSSCKKEDEVIDVKFSGKVLIIGAGASGLMAAYMLNQYNIDFEIIEASGVFGGRVKKIDNFADFPIDLGAEWIHDEPSIFGRLINDDNVQGSIDLITYQPDTLHGWNNNTLYKHNWARPFYSEYKFKRTTWYDFLADYIAPKVMHNIRYNSPVKEINYTGAQVVVTDTNNNTYQGDRVIVTVPTPVLQQNTINFLPDLPADKKTAFSELYTPDGIKVFIEFSERFYPDILLMGPLIGDTAQEKIFYDAAFRKDANRHVLGLFCVGDGATEYVNLSDQAIFTKIMGELDTIYDGKATQYYLKHVIQNWSAEPYILGSYTHHSSGGEAQRIGVMNEPVDNKVYFAGEAYSEEAAATVHGAGLSAYNTVRNLLQQA